MTLIVPRFPPDTQSRHYRFFHEMSPKARQHMIEQSVWIRGGRLDEMPQKSSGEYPWLACLITVDTVPQLIVCETWDDVCRFQTLFEFERRFTPEWYWIQNWAAIQSGRAGRLPPPPTQQPG